MCNHKIRHDTDNGIRVLWDSRCRWPKVVMIYLVWDLRDPEPYARNHCFGPYSRLSFQYPKKIAILGHLNGIMESARKLSCRRSTVPIAKEHGQ